MYQRDALQVDHDELKRYLPVRDVVEGALKIYQDMLGLTFEMTAGEFEGGASNGHKENDNNNHNEINNNSQWKLGHDIVKVFRVRDKASGELLGHFLLDLYAREGKYGYACKHFFTNLSCNASNMWSKTIRTNVILQKYHHKCLIFNIKHIVLL